MCASNSSCGGFGSVLRRSLLTIRYVPRTSCSHVSLDLPSRTARLSKDMLSYMAAPKKPRCPLPAR